MNNVNKTLYIPLYGKSYVSRRGILLADPMAEELWEEGGFPLKGKSQSVEKVQLSWAFSVSCDIIFQGDVRCWNAGKWNVESLKS